MATIPRILAVNPGSRYIGLAVFEKSNLWHWGIRTLFYNKSEKNSKIKKIYDELMEFYGFDILAIKKLHPSRSSPDLISITKEFKRISKVSNIPIYEYSIQEVKQFFFPNQKASKKILIEELCNDYRYLLNELETKKKKRNVYAVRMFEAIALGKVCSEQLDRNQSTLK